jgi:alpha-ketoglutarate-dependent 2,4-dichlorophenoxyacetate dioxygenase
MLIRSRCAPAEEEPMALNVRRMHPYFVGEVQDPPALRDVRDAQTLDAIRDAMDEHAVLVFHDQAFDDREQMDFARRLDGELHAKTGARVLSQSRLGTEAMADISNVGENGALLAADDRRRLYSLANRLWHTDASFEEPAGRYSMLHARVVPDDGGPDTQFADMRAAYDALPEETRALIADLRAHHSIAHSRATLGFEFSPDEQAILEGAEHPLVRTLPRSGRHALYLASHASRIVGWSLPEGRLLLRELMEHATRPEFVHGHHWRPGDLVIWDNRATMHRARPFADTRVRREMRRVTTLDIEAVPAAARSA